MSIVMATLLGEARRERAAALAECARLKAEVAELLKANRYLQQWRDRVCHANDDLRAQLREAREAMQDTLEWLRNDDGHGSTSTPQGWLEAALASIARTSKGDEPQTPEGGDRD